MNPTCMKRTICLELGTVWSITLRTRLHASEQRAFTRACDLFWQLADAKLISNRMRSLRWCHIPQ